MPVRITDMMPPCQTSIADVNIGSDRGFAEMTAGPSSERDRGLAAVRTTRM